MGNSGGGKGGMGGMNNQGENTEGGGSKGVSRFDNPLVASKRTSRTSDHPEGDHFVAREGGNPGTGDDGEAWTEVRKK